MILVYTEYQSGGKTDMSDAFQKDMELGRGTPADQSAVITGGKFIMYDSDYIGDIEIPGNTLGPTPKVVCTVAAVTAPDEKTEVGFIGAAGEKLKGTESDDFPIVAEYIEFTSKEFNTVGHTVQKIEDWNEETAEKYGVPF